MVFRLNPEPVLFFYSVSLGLYISIYQAFIKFQLCLDYPVAPFYENPKICHALKNFTTVENEISEEAAHFALYLQICSSIPAFVVSFFIGAWSDANGRKTPLMAALAGITLNNCLLIFVSTVRGMPLWIMLIAAFFTSLSGHMIIVFSSCFSMITDTFREPNLLTIRIGVASGLTYLGIVFGSLLSSFITTEMAERSYSYAFLASGLFMFLALLYSALFVSETIDLISSNDLSIVQVPDEDESGCVKFKHFFNIERIKECFMTLVRHREGRNRLYLNLAFVAFLVVFSCDVGMPGLQYLFVTMPPLNFSDYTFSNLVAFQTISGAVGMAIVPALFKKVLHLADIWLIIVAVLFSIAKAFLFAFSQMLWMVFLSGSCNIFASLFFPGFRAYLTKLVDVHETARLFALLSSLEHVGPLVSGVIFNNIFANTLNFFPGFTWIVGGSIQAMMLLLICWIQLDTYKRCDLVSIDESRTAILNDEEVNSAVG